MVEYNEKATNDKLFAFLQMSIMRNEIFIVIKWENRFFLKKIELINVFCKFNHHWSVIAFAVKNVFIFVSS